VRFYLGTHQPSWLSQTDTPLFVSRIRLAPRVKLPRARGPWALDSGGFSELDGTGTWSLGPKEYAAFVRRCRDEVGNLEWAAVQDWMCEPRVREKTRQGVEDHQLRTVISYLELRDEAPEVPWVPVLQGWGVCDYWRHVEQYRRLGVDLAKLPRVGVGTVCRRQNAVTGAVIVRSLATGFGLRNLHGFGFKVQGLELAGDVLASADSLAWSFHASKRDPLPECRAEGKHKQCQNCIRYALRWRGRLLDNLAAAESPPAPAVPPADRVTRQPTLFDRVA
jgi:hypothetical protein